MLNRDEILGIEDLVSELVDVPEWGGQVRVRCMTGQERDQFEAVIFEQSQNKSKPEFTNLRARLVAMTVIGEDGKRLFSDKDVSVLGQKNAQVLDRIFAVARRLSGLTQTEMGEMEKNSESAPTEDSSSD